MITGGKHLGVVREWMQRYFCFGNGEYVTWGSHDKLTGRDIYVDVMESLAQDIRNAVLDEYNTKPKEHVYKFVIIADAPFSQKVDTSYEAWCSLYKIVGHVVIYRLDDNTHLGLKIFEGEPEQVRNWVLENNLEDL